MRIAYVCTDPGIPVFGRKGASVHAQAVLTELVRAGHEVHLLTPRPGGEPASGDPLAQVVVHPLPEIGRGAAAARELRAQAQRCPRRRAAVRSRPGPGLRAVRAVGPHRHRRGPPPTGSAASWRSTPRWSREQASFRELVARATPPRRSPADALGRPAPSCA